MRRRKNVKWRFSSSIVYNQKRENQEGEREKETIRQKLIILIILPWLKLLIALLLNYIYMKVNEKEEREIQKLGENIWQKSNWLD